MVDYVWIVDCGRVVIYGIVLEFIVELSLEDVFFIYISDCVVGRN